MRKYVLCAIFLLAFVPFVYSDTTESLTPVSYEVTVTLLEFYNSDTVTWVTAGQGELAFDIASVSAGQSAGSYVSGANLSSGTYTKMRCTLLRDIKIKAYSTATGYYTTTSQTGWTGGTNGHKIVIATGADPAGSVQLGTMHSPDEANQNAPSGETYDNIDVDHFRETWETPMFVPFTYTQGNSMKLRINFDVTNKVTFNETTNTCYTEAPTITITTQ